MIPASKAWFWNCRADPAGSGRGWWWGMESGCNGVGPAHSWSLIDPSSSSDTLSGCCMEGGLEGGWVGPGGGWGGAEGEEREEG